MNELSGRSTSLRLLALFLVVGTAISLTALGGMYFASFATHSMWLAVTKARPQSVEDFPLWLWIPSAAITVSLVFLVSYVLQRLRLRERLVGDGNPTNS
jgi:TRAP-type C4-dicarboxylate transport system permease small subunit